MTSKSTKAFGIITTILLLISIVVRIVRVGIGSRESDGFASIMLGLAISAAIIALILFIADIYFRRYERVITSLINKGVDASLCIISGQSSYSILTKNKDGVAISKVKKDKLIEIWNFRWLDSSFNKVSVHVGGSSAASRDGVEVSGMDGNLSFLIFSPGAGLFSRSVSGKTLDGVIYEWNSRARKD